MATFPSVALPPSSCTCLPARRQLAPAHLLACRPQELLDAAAASRKDAALRHVIISEKRNKKASKFTTAGVPFPFKTREQFERSLRNPLGLEWNTAASHAQQVEPRVRTVRGTTILPIAGHRKTAGKRKA